MLSVNVNTVIPEPQFDLNQQSLPASFDQGAVVDGVVYFSGISFERRGDDSAIWSYDPAANDGAGEVRQLELTGDTHDLEIVRYIDAYDGKLYVRSYNASKNHLLTIDPTTSVVTKIATLSSSINSDHVTYDEMIVHDGDLYYRDGSTSGGMGVWRYTPGVGTTEVASFQMGAGETAHEMFLINDKIYLNVIGANNKFQIWEYDPANEAAEVTSLVFETSTANNDSPEMATANGKIYFTTEANRSLWEVDLQADPTPTGTQVVYLPDFTNSSTTDILDLVALKGKLYWTSSQRGSVSFWQYDPESGEDPLNLGRDILPGKFPSIINLSAGEDYLYLLTSLRNRYSTGGTAYSFPGEAILKYDPSQPLADSTTIISDIDLGSGNWYTEKADVFEVGNSILFPGQTDHLRYDTLLRYDAGNEGEPGQLTEVRQSIELNESSNPHELTVIGKTLFFTATDGIHGYELWKATIQADGSVTSPEMIADLYTGVIGSNPQNLAVIDGVLYFDAEDQGVDSLYRYNPEGDELTRLDSTGPYTEVVTIGNRRYYFWFGSHEVYLNYYEASSPDSAGEMTEVPDFLVERINGQPHHTTAIGDQVYFAIKNAVTGDEGIYVYDTTANNGMNSPKRIELPSGVTYAKRFIGFNGKVYFHAAKEIVNGGLFEYNPSDDSIRQITDSNSGDSYFYPSRLTVFNDQLYFRAHDGSSTFQLWRFDPTVNDGLGEVQLAFDSHIYSWTSGSYHDEGSPFLVHDGRMYVDADFNRARGLNILVFEPDADDRPLTLTESIAKPPSSYFDYEYVVAGNHIVTNMFGEIEGRELYSIPLISGELHAEFRYAADPNDIAGTVENSPSDSTPTFGEWDSHVGQIWLTVGPNTVEQVFDLSVELEWDTLWFLGPEVTSHLGTDATSINQTNSGTRTSSVTISGVDLSSYEIGDRVLVGTLEFSLDPDKSTNVLIDNPLPVPRQGAALTGVKNSSTRQPVLFDDEQGNLQITPMQYDVNDDDRVGIADFAEFIRNYGRQADESSPEAYRFDYNRDGRVGIADFALFITYYGDRKFPLATPAARKSIAIEIEPDVAPSLSVSSYQLEGEPDPSIYLGTMLVQPSESAIDNVIHTELKHGVESVDALDLPVDPSWDAQIVDAAMQSGELSYAATSDKKSGFNLTLSAEFDPYDSI
ncbi:dockerin type I domain-containing protein [Bremerella alba]|nr:dockerin type I domain-containing protein [Bremerella alba]